MIFIDASALVALIAKEREAIALAACIDTEPQLAYSAMFAWETMAALCRSYGFRPPEARQKVEIFTSRLDVNLVPIGETEYELAAKAYENFGKGRHRAALNMGDCFAYACARANRAKLLFIGDDFAATDIAVALVL